MHSISGVFGVIFDLRFSCFLFNNLYLMQSSYICTFNSFLLYWFTKFSIIQAGNCLYFCFHCFFFDWESSPILLKKKYLFLKVHWNVLDGKFDNPDANNVQPPFFFSLSAAEHLTVLSTNPAAHSLHPSAVDLICCSACNFKVLDGRSHKHHLC